MKWISDTEYWAFPSHRPVDGANQWVRSRYLVFFALCNIFGWRASSKFKGVKIFKKVFRNRFFFKKIVIIDFEEKEAHMVNLPTLG